MRGDLSSTNSVIARNHDELVLLEHKGDRNYYEFTLTKGQKQAGGYDQPRTEERPTRSRTGSRSTCFADDKTYEKKDRNVNEPLQFYSGKSPALYEIVVNSINSKNQITGYLATPK